MTAMMTTVIIPSPTLKKTLSGTIMTPSTATTTVIPLKSTARLAVAPVAAIAVQFLTASGPLLAVPRDYEEGVVDPDSQADDRYQVLSERLDLDGLADKQHGAEGYDYRRDGYDHRQNSRRQSAEQDREDDQRDGDPERLSPLRVLLVTLHKVPGEGRLAGDEDLEAVVGLRIIDYVEDLLDVGLGLFEPSPT